MRALGSRVRRWSTALPAFALLACQAERAATPPPTWPSLPPPPVASSQPASDESERAVEEPDLPFGEDEGRAIVEVALLHPDRYREPQVANILLAEVSHARLEPDVAAAVERAAQSLPQGLGLRVVEGYRTPERQLELMRHNCENPPGHKSCLPRPAQPPTCMMRLGDRHSCPHTTGRAVDLLGVRQRGEDWRQCVSQRQCLTGELSLELSAELCRADPCQAAVIAAMRDQGFCVHALQPWHFELPALSAGCQ